MKSETIRAEWALEETYWWFVGRRSMLEQLLRRFARRGGLALDVGCGSGRNFEILAPYADCVLGLDRSLTALGLAAAHGLPTACADGQAIPVASASLDLVSALDVLEHLDEDQLALQEFHRVLRPGGLLLLTVPAYRFLWSEHDEALMHRRRYVASELHMKLTRGGSTLSSELTLSSSCFSRYSFTASFAAWYPRIRLRPWLRTFCFPLL